MMSVKKTSRDNEVWEGLSQHLQEVSGGQIWHPLRCHQDAFGRCTQILFHQSLEDSILFHNDYKSAVTA